MFFPELIAEGGVAEGTIRKYRVCMRHGEKNIKC